MSAKTFRRWLQGLIGAAIGGAVNAITNIIIDPVAFNLHEQWRKTLLAAAVSAVLGACLYLKQAPVPMADDDEIIPRDWNK